MPDIDWSALYTSEVLPAMERFAAPPPAWVLVALGLLGLGGVALLVLGSGSVRLASVVPLGAAGFIAFMAFGQPSRVGEPGLYRTGTISALTKRSVVQSTTRGVDERRTIHEVELAVEEEGRFDESGVLGEPVRDGSIVVLFLDEALFGALSEGQRATLVSYPGATASSVAFAVIEGTVVR